MRQLTLLPFLFFILSGNLLWGDPCDSIPVTATASGGTLTCSTPYVNIKANGGPSTVSYKWSGPGGFSSTQQTSNVVVPGNYLLTVTGPQGCTATALAVVVNQCTDPVTGLDPPPCPYTSNFLPEPIPGEDCMFTCVSPCLIAYFGATTDFSGGVVPYFCSNIQNDQWFAFMATQSFVQIKATPSNCSNGQGIQMAIYAECGGPPIACDGGCATCGDVPITLTAEGLIPGKAYFVVIDGYSGDQCDFYLEDNTFTFCSFLTTTPCDTFPCDTLTPSSFGCLTGINGPTEVCPGGTYEYHLSYNPNCITTAFMWTAPPGCLINGEPSPVVFNNPEGKSVFITYPSNGFVIIPVTVRTLTYFQAPALPVFLEVTSTKIPETILPAVIVCWENTPYELPWGELVEVTGTYKYTDYSFSGCDSVISIHVTVKPPLFTNLGNLYICQGESVSVCGEVYAASGLYSCPCTSFLGCDSTVTINLVVLDPVAEITGGSGLSCTQPAIILTSAPGSNSPGQSMKIWKKLPDTIVGSGDAITITTPGTYVLTTTAFGGNKQCIATDTIVVTSSIAIPALTLTGGDLSCNQPSVTLETTTDIVFPAYAWTGPPGVSLSPFSSNTIAVPGNYTVTITNTLNGCTAAAAVLVNGFSAPIVNVQGGILNCVDTAVQVTASVAMSPVSYVWTGPGVTGSGPSIMANQPGQYSVVATNTGGCTGTAVIDIVQDITPPDLLASQIMPVCGDTLMYLMASSNTPGVMYTWSGPGNFYSGQANPVVSISGQYAATAIAPNGCSVTRIISANSPPLPPVLEVASTTLTCAAMSAQLSATADVPGTAFLWTGPDGFLSSQPAINVDNTGPFVVTAITPGGCTAVETVGVPIDVTPPGAMISGVQLITCDAPFTTLTGSSMASPVAFVWSGPGINNQEGPQISVSEAGTYTLTATGPNGCTSTAYMDILIDVGPFEFQVNQIAPVCGDTLIYLESVWPSIVVMVSWTGPGNFVSPLANPVVSEPGLYTVTATTLNGCTAVAAIDVFSPPEIPELTVQGDSITCTDPVAQLSVSSSVPGTSYNWTGPNNFNSNLAEPNTDSTGVYQVVAVTPDGCTNTATVVANGGCKTVSTNIVANTSGIRVFPVPGKGLLYVECAGGWAGRDLIFQVFDAAGKNLWSSVRSAVNTRETLDLRHLPAGNYQLLVNGAGEVARFGVVLVE